MAHNRNQLYKHINMAKSQLGLDEETYRAMLARFGAVEKGGRISATTLGFGELFKVYNHLVKSGYKPRQRSLYPQQVKLCFALWSELSRRELVDNADFSAMASWFRRRFGQDIDRASSAVLRDAIEHLKRWRDRQPQSAPPERA